MICFIDILFIYSSHQMHSHKFLSFEVAVHLKAPIKHRDFYWISSFVESILGENEVFCSRFLSDVL